MNLTEKQLLEELRQYLDNKQLSGHVEQALLNRAAFLEREMDDLEASKQYTKDWIAALRKAQQSMSADLRKIAAALE